MNHSGSDPHYRRNHRYQYRSIRTHPMETDLRCLKPSPTESTLRGVIRKVSTPSKTPSLSESLVRSYSITVPISSPISFHHFRAKTLYATGTERPILRLIARLSWSDSHQAPSSPNWCNRNFWVIHAQLLSTTIGPTQPDVGRPGAIVSLSELIARFVRQLASSGA